GLGPHLRELGTHRTFCPRNLRLRRANCFQQNLVKAFSLWTTGVVLAYRLLYEATAFQEKIGRRAPIGPVKCSQRSLFPNFFEPNSPGGRNLNKPVVNNFQAYIP